MPASLVAKNDGSFYLKGEKIVLLSGAVHYFRVVPEYWSERLKQVKFCGLNCVETYVPWNLHEEVKGEFNFSGMLDLVAFLKMAHYLDLYVILRPGPYICSEWDFGGLPSWLLTDPNMKVRSSYKPFLNAVKSYFDKLLPLVEGLQHSKGGPIICVQLENEYGSYGDDLEYMKFLKETVLRNGIEELLFTSDNGVGLRGERLSDVLMTANFQDAEQGHLMLEYIRNVKQPRMPLMVMEFWTGWFDHWGEGHQVVPTEQFEKTLTWMLDQGCSVNFYMFHGGTNFGFMNGANESDPPTTGNDYAADVTSYDYDAPVSECGELNEKYFSIKSILDKRHLFRLDEGFTPPERYEPHSYGSIEVQEYLPFNDMLSSVEAIASKMLLFMENLPINNGGGQSFGFILYRTVVKETLEFLKIVGRVRDRAIILLNGQEAAFVDRKCVDYGLKVRLETEGDVVVDILVENMGRVNYADFNSPILNDQRKGIGLILINDKPVEDWSIYPLEFKRSFMHSMSSSKSWKPFSKDLKLKSPTLYRATLDVSKPLRDTFVSIDGWSKGVVFINGFNLGRYWDRGPQKTLYLPGPLLKEGQNEIIIFELHAPSDNLALLSNPDLGEPVRHQANLPASARAQLFLLRNALKMGSWVWSVMKPFVK